MSCLNTLIIHTYIGRSTAPIKPPLISIPHCRVAGLLLGIWYFMTWKVGVMQQDCSSFSVCRVLWIYKPPPRRPTPDPSASQLIPTHLTTYLLIYPPTVCTMLSGLFFFARAHSPPPPSPLPRPLDPRPPTPDPTPIFFFPSERVDTILIQRWGRYLCKWVLYMYVCIRIYTGGRLKYIW